MKINEITSSDKLWAKTSYVDINFEQDLKDAQFNMSALSNMKGTQFYLKAYNIFVNRPMNKIIKFIKFCEQNNVPDMDNDPDVQRALEIYDELKKIE